VGILLLSFLYKILFYILPSKLGPYVDEIIANYQCERALVNTIMNPLLP
jgi:hypothetical protein